MGVVEVTAFLTYLAVELNFAPSTQNQAKSALLFLYRAVLEVQLPCPYEIVAAKDKRRLTVALTPMELRVLLDELAVPMGLVASLLCSTGMRLLEGLRLRVKNVGFERRELIVPGQGRQKPGHRLAGEADVAPQGPPGRVKVRHARDVADGLGNV